MLICVLTAVLAALCLFGCTNISDKETSGGSSASGDTANTDSPQLISSMTDEELIAFLEENDFELPENWGRSLTDSLEVVRDFIADIEEYPSLPSPYGMVQYRDLIEALKPIVNGYYGITDYR